MNGRHKAGTDDKPTFRCRPRSFRCAVAFASSPWPVMYALGRRRRRVPKLFTPLPIAGGGGERVVITSRGTGCPATLLDDRPEGAQERRSGERGERERAYDGGRVRACVTGRPRESPGTLAAAASANTPAGCWLTNAVRPNRKRAALLLFS